jgi:hypothetical protein
VAAYRAAAEAGVVGPVAGDLVGVPLRAVPVTASSFLAACEAQGRLVASLDLGGLATSHRRCAEEATLDARGAEQVGQGRDREREREINDANSAAKPVS